MWLFHTLLALYSWFYFSESHSWRTDDCVLTMCPCVPLLSWLMNMHDFCLSQQGSQRSARGLRKAWRKERGGKKSFFPSQARPESNLFGGKHLPCMRDGYCPSCSKGWGGSLRAHLCGEGGSGEEWEGNLNFSEATSRRQGLWQRDTLIRAVGWELDIASPWWLYVLGCINHDRSAQWHVSACMGRFGLEEEDKMVNGIDALFSTWRNYL